MRCALLLLAVAACGGGGSAGAPDAAPPDAPAAFDPLDGIGAVTRVGGGYQFLEGPQWRDATGTLLFSDLNGDQIWELTPPSAVASFRTPSNLANGNALAPDGTLITCQHGTRSVTITTALAGTVTTLADSYQGHRLNSPNDVVARGDGTIYFTDPPYGIQDSQRELDFIGVFRVPPGGGAPIAEYQGPLTARPNGIALSPDQRTLYVDDTDAGLVRAYDVADDGSLSGARTFSSDAAGGDGMAIDVGGHLFVSASDGVRVLGPDGATLGTIAVPEQPANVAFGGADHRTLYITARTSLYQVTLAHPGLPTS